MYLPAFHDVYKNRLRDVATNSVTGRLSITAVDRLRTASPVGVIPASFEVKQTTLVHPKTGVRYSFEGLFTKRNISKYEFIGTYESEDVFGPRWKGRSEYAMEVQAMDKYQYDGKTYALLTPRKTPIHVVDARYPDRSTFLRYMNSSETNPSVMFAEALGTGGPVVVAFALRDIPAGSELFVDYGPKFRIEV